MGSHGSSEASYEASFEPMNMASLADMTRKLAFLLTLASARARTITDFCNRLILLS